MWRKMCCYCARMHRRTMSKDHWLVLTVACHMLLMLLMLLLSDTAVVMPTVLFVNLFAKTMITHVSHGVNLYFMSVTIAYMQTMS